MAVGGSYGENGKIEINALKDNLRTIAGANGIDSITNLPAKIEVDGYNIVIEKNGNVIFENEYEKPSVYARLYKKNETEEAVLILASKESAFQDYSSDLSLSNNMGNIYEKEYTEEDLYEMPEYAEILNSDGWKQYKEKNPVGAQEEIQSMLDFLNNNIPWLMIAEGTYVDVYGIVEVRIIDEIYPLFTGKWFSNCGSLEKIVGIENLNTSNVTNMEAMFEGCSNLTTLNLSSFNTSKVTNMGSMFSGCSKLTTIDLSNFDTSNVTGIGMAAMFSRCSNLATIDLSSFDTSRVEHMTHMFESCSSLTKLDLRSFDTSSCINMLYMFYRCENLTQIMVGKNWTFATVRDGIFEDCGVSDVTYVTESN